MHMCMPAGLLTQFQQLGDSLMEATERQTQPTPHDSFNKHTLAVHEVRSSQLVHAHFMRHPRFMAMATSCQDLGAGLILPTCHVIASCAAVAAG